MPYQDFLLDPILSRRLLEAQGEAPDVIAGLSDQGLFTARQEAGARVTAAIADVGYQGQARAQDEDSGCGSRLPVARLVEGVCLWMDPRLSAALALEFGLNERQDGKLLGSLVAQFQAFASANTVSGDFGQVACNHCNGEVAIDLAPIGVEPAVRSTRRPSMA